MRTLHNKAIKENALKDYDQVWCIFDKDDIKDDDFNNVIKKAQNNGLKVAYSVQSFEYWILLHFENHQGDKLSRQDCHDRINKYLKASNSKLKYQKEITQSIHDILEDNPGDAIARAKIIHQNKKGMPPSKQESITLFYELVEEILKRS